MKVKYLFIFLLFTNIVVGQNENLTAEQIIDSSIAFCGGFTSDKRSELKYSVLLADSSTAIIDEKRIEGEKYSQSILSMTNMSQTTFFDGKRLTRIDGDTIIRSKSIDEIKLKTYTNLQVGYKELNYTIKREEDKKFKSFDCYVIRATSPKGYSTLNYLDKTNFRLLMVIYPNGNKSLMIEYLFRESTLINSLIINTIANSPESQSIKLIRYKTDRNYSDLWFKSPYKDEVKIPDFIKYGNFKSTNGPDTKFIRTNTLQNYFDKKNDKILTRFLKWINVDSMILRSEDDIENNNMSPESNILVRIISWDSGGYVCQWIAGKYSDTQDYQIIK